MKLSKYVLIGLLTIMVTYLLSLGFSSGSAKTTNKDKANVTVEVLRTDGHGGGTGVIINSTSKESFILTNNHVCEAISSGGLIVTDEGSSYPVVKYRQSKLHDLCMVSVAVDLHRKTQVANYSPEIYSDSEVSGHPHLMQTIITKGHFSGRSQISVVMGVRACTEEDLNSPNAIYCILMGGMPIVKSFDAQLISPTIMSGSSGSAVYNSQGELSGLVFAGSGELSYAYIVPLEYVLLFLEEEVDTLEVVVPGEQVKTPKAEKTNCKSIHNAKVRNFCKFITLLKGLQ